MQEQGKTPIQIMEFCLLSLYLMQGQLQKCFTNHQIWYNRLADIINMNLVTGLFVLVHSSKNAQLFVFLLDFSFYISSFIQARSIFLQQPAALLFIVLGICQQNGKGYLTNL